MSRWCFTAKSCLTLLWPAWTVWLTKLLCPWISQANILERVAISFSRKPSYPKDQTPVSCVGRWILYHWTTREALGNEPFVNQWEKKKDFKRTVRNRHVDEITFLRNEGRYSLDLLSFCISRIQEMSNQQCLPSELTINILCKWYSLHKGQMLMVRPRQHEKSIDKNIFVYNLSPWIFWALYMLYLNWV